ncbi:MULTISPECIES: DinB family protein [Bacillales]|uniref:DinB family protein n=1 Tax=Brevibacillus TaxID=55080 RepID=UPI001492076F|nr:DinB family protein [Anoxybacillus sediminis]MBR8658086.1 DinB family protein [Brevibacillus sp. NL20B1]NNV01572.1 DinB family protein [Brevibacillus sp. MCWH]UFJ61220.1 DinB family protein [Anoxybacillus sediminis]
MHDYAFVWKQYDLVRGITLAVLKDLPTEQADIVPEGFSNNIRWNLGHILTVQESCMYGLEFTHLPASYKTLFGPGTKPADWQGEVPSLSTLAEQLEEQKERIKRTFRERLNQELPQPFVLRNTQMTTLGEMFVFSLFHEGMHISTINTLKKALAITHS